MMINKEHETFQFTQLNNNINRLSTKTKISVFNKGLTQCIIMDMVVDILTEVKIR
jgi:hypothetical protein